MNPAAPLHSFVNDVSGLNPVPVWASLRPTCTADVQDALRRTRGPVSVGGGRFSMGGQAASPGSLHLDMRGMNRVLQFSPAERTLRVEAGIRWCDIQRFIDPHGLAVKIMQTYANFTVGGSLAVNVHGRYVGLGPLIQSVRSLRLVLADGDVVDASPSAHADLFYGSIGGYGALGVIVEAELELADNTRVEQHDATMPVADYAAWFHARVRDDARAVFHNADLYPPHYTRVRAVTWTETDKPATHAQPLVQPRRHHPVASWLLWSVSELPFGPWRREHLIDPLIYSRPRVHWRNFEAGYDAAELEPPSRARRTWVLQEYFVPVARFDEFVPRLAEILQRHRVNVLNVSIRHARPDPGSLLAWAREECFAFVLYYKQRTRPNACRRVAVWTRELIDAALAVGGTYYLPYQPHATDAQFHRAYPRAGELFALKRSYDPHYRLRNVLWDTYYAPSRLAGDTPVPAASAGCHPSLFHRVFATTSGQDAVYRFLQNIFHVVPEDRLHALIAEACAAHADDAAIYRHIQAGLPAIRPLLAPLTFALPSLATQKREMGRQASLLCGDRRDRHGYVEIGTTGRYVSAMRNAAGLRGPVWLVNDVAPGYSPVDIAERGSLRPAGQFVPLHDYAPIAPADIPDQSADLVSCFVGLHHIAPGARAAFVASIARILRPGGLFLLRDHDVTSPAMDDLVSLAHTLFNAGLGCPWETNAAEPRHFAPLATWTQLLAEAGLVDAGQRLVQPHDPTGNVLMAFRRPEASA